jgi:hypothetical protein
MLVDIVVFLRFDVTVVDVTAADNVYGLVIDIVGRHVCLGITISTPKRKVRLLRLLSAPATLVCLDERLDWHSI